MDLSLLQRTAAMREEEEKIQSQLSMRPKLSFSVASLLASAARPRSPPEEEQREEEDEIKDDDDHGMESDEESDVSVGSHDEEEAGMLYNSRLNDSSDPDHQDASSPLSPEGGRPVSPPRSDGGMGGHPRLAMPTPLLGARGFPGLPPGVHLPGGGIFPPGWPSLLPPGLQGLNPNLFKSGTCTY